MPPPTLILTSFVHLTQTLILALTRTGTLILTLTLFLNKAANGVPALRGRAAKGKVLHP